MDENLRRSWIYYTNYTLITKGKKVSLQVEKSDRNRLNQVIKVKGTQNKWDKMTSAPPQDTLMYHQVMASHQVNPY